MLKITISHSSIPEGSCCKAVQQQLKLNSNVVQFGKFHLTRPEMAGTACDSLARNTFKNEITHNTPQATWCTKFAVLKGSSRIANFVTWNNGPSSFWSPLLVMLTDRLNWYNASYSLFSSTRSACKASKATKHNIVISSRCGQEGIQGWNQKHRPKCRNLKPANALDVIAWD